MCGTVLSSSVSDTECRTRADGVRYLTLEASPGFEISWPHPWLSVVQVHPGQCSLNGPDLCPQNQAVGVQPFQLLISEVDIMNERREGGGEDA